MGCDREDNHELLREALEIESIIPPKAGRPTVKLHKGKWRWLMATDFDDERYTQRWQVETVMFMLKTRQGESLTSRSYLGRRRELGLIVLVHNLMIVWIQEGFYRAGPTQPKCCLLIQNGLADRPMTLASGNRSATRR